MVLFLIGLGLGDEKDITVRGLECVRNCSRVYLEYYTSILGVDKAVLEAYYGVPIIAADRYMVESEAEQMYLDAVTENIAFLVVGDPLCATTHTDLILRARKIGAKVETIHNASVMAAVAGCGLQLYQYGYTVSIPLFEGDWRPTSFYDRIKYNKVVGMHTLCLLDIKVKEPDPDAMAMGRMKFLPPRFMTVNTAIEQLLEVEDVVKGGILSPTTKAVGMARLGQKTQKIVYGSLEELLRVDFGGPLHCMAICGEMHALEEELLQEFSVKESDYKVETDEAECSEEV